MEFYCSNFISSQTVFDTTVVFQVGHIFIFKSWAKNSDTLSENALNSWRAVFPERKYVDKCIRDILHHSVDQLKFDV